MPPARSTTVSPSRWSQACEREKVPGVEEKPEEQSRAQPSLAMPVTASIHAICCFRNGSYSKHVENELMAKVVTA
jgi:hypothetical protein